MRVEGMTVAEAVAYIKDWPGPPQPRRKTAANAEKLAFVKSIWTSAQPLVRFDGRTLSRRDPAYRRQQAAGGHPPQPALPSELCVWSGHALAVPDRIDARSAHR